ncbi:MAG: restriction endonuclease subunit S [Pseudonocardiaceae bacterium]
MAADTAIDIRLPLHVPGAYGDLPPGWSWSRLDALCKGVYDCPHSTPKLAPSGAYLARTQDISSGVFRPERAARVSDETYTERTARVVPHEGDLLYSREGTYFGVAAEVPPDTKICLGQRMVLIRPDEKALDFRFLRHWLNSPIMAEYINGFRDGSVAERLNLPTIRSLPVPVPPIPEQRKISDTLGAVEEKIESIRRQSTLIAEFVPTLFSSIVGVVKTFTRFDTLANCVKGASYRSADLQPSSTALVTLKSFDRNGGYKTSGLKQYTGPYKSSQLLKPGDLVVAQTDITQAAEVVGRVVRVPEQRTFEFLVASLDLLIIRPIRDIPIEFLYGVMLEEDFREHCRSRTSGTTVLHLASDAVPAYRAPQVEPRIQRHFAATVKPLLIRQDAIGHELASLSAIGNALLPALLSRRIRFAEAHDIGGTLT